MEEWRLRSLLLPSSPGLDLQRRRRVLDKGFQNVGGFVLVIYKHPNLLGFRIGASTV